MYEFLFFFSAAMCGGFSEELPQSGVDCFGGRAQVNIPGTQDVTQIQVTGASGDSNVINPVQQVHCVHSKQTPHMIQAA